MNGSVLIGIAGLIATVAVSAIGFYYTHKAQRSPLREQLYARQMEILISFTVVTTRIQQVADALGNASALSPEEIKQAQDLWDDLTGDLLEVTQKAGVVMPADLYSAITAYRACTEEFKQSLVREGGSGEAYFGLMGAATHVFMMGREMVGADSLSVESLNLHSADGYKKMKQAGRVAFAKVCKALWTRSGNENPQ